MSITDELRKWGYGFCGSTYEVVNAIADRIDEKADEEATRKYLAGFDEGFASADDWMNMNENDLSKHGWFKLPVDADGKPIHVGDVMEYAGDVMEWIDPGGDYSLVCEVCAVSIDCFFAWDKVNGRFTQKDARAYHRKHAPTVEDVLAEFANRVCNSGHQWGLDADIAIAEFAKKLQLKEEA